MNKEIKITLPKSWNELTDLQFVKICGLMYLGAKSKNQFEVEAFKIMAVSDNPTKEEKSNLFTILQNVPISELSEHLQFIFKENTRTIFPKKIDADIEVFAPFDRISNLTASEFAVADDFHIKFRETKNIEYLYYLAATLYVEKQQPRPEFDKNNLEIMVPKFRNVPLAQLYAIEIAYAGSKENIVLKFKKAFPKSGKKSAKKFGFGKVILEMAGRKFGNHAETMKTNVYTFLAEFEENLNQKPQK